MKSTRYIALLIGGAVLALSAGTASAQRSNRYDQGTRAQSSTPTRQSAPSYQGTTTSRPSYGVQQYNAGNRSTTGFGQTADRSSSSRIDNGYTKNRQTTTTTTDRFNSSTASRDGYMTRDRQANTDAMRSYTTDRTERPSVYQRTVSNDRNDRTANPTASSTRFDRAETVSRTNDRFESVNRDNAEVRKSFTSTPEIDRSTRTEVAPSYKTDNDKSNLTIDREQYEDNASEFRHGGGHHGGGHGGGYYHGGGHYRPGPSYYGYYRPYYRPYCPPVYSYRPYYGPSYSYGYYSGYGGSVYYSDGPFSIGWRW